MLITFIPLFDKNMNLRIYSLFTQKQNFLLNPSMLGTGKFDGAARVDGLEVIQNMGIDTLAIDKDVFVTITSMSIFSDLKEQCNVDPKRIVFLMDNMVKPEEMYINRIKELKEEGFRFGIRKIQVSEFEAYKPILELVDFILLNHNKIDISKAKIYFRMMYPHIKLCAVNVENQEVFERLKLEENGYDYYEGEFYRVPVTKGQKEVSPLKVNYIELLNIVNQNDFDLSDAADIIGQDTALTFTLLRMVNRIAINSEITSIRHAAAMLGQKELKKWITTAVVGELCSDKPNEITRISLIRAKFMENLAGLFGEKTHASELFLLGIFSVIDVVLEKSMEEALEMIYVPQDVKDALIKKTGPYARIYEFMQNYEKAEWQEVSRQLIIEEISLTSLYEVYTEALVWYRKLVLGN